MTPGPRGLRVDDVAEDGSDAVETLVLDRERLLERLELRELVPDLVVAQGVDQVAGHAWLLEGVHDVGVEPCAGVPAGKRESTGLRTVGIVLGDGLGER